MKKIYYCKSCNSTWGGESGEDAECPNCKAPLVETDFLADVWHEKTEDEKASLRKQFSEKYKNNGAVSKTEDADDHLPTAITIVSYIVMVLCIIGSLAIISELGFAFGFATMLASVLLCLLAFGIGDICKQLRDINKKLNRLK